MDREKTQVNLTDGNFIESKTLFIYNIVSLIIVIVTVAMGVAYIQKDVSANKESINELNLAQKELSIHCESHDKDQIDSMERMEERIRKYAYERSQANKREIEKLIEKTDTNKESAIILQQKLISIEGHISSLDSNMNKLITLLDKILEKKNE